MSRTFKINRDYYGDGVKLYKKATIELNPGITVFIGCNGSGKTTLVSQLSEQIKKLDLPCVKFDNLKDGGSRARSRAAFVEDFSFLATSLQSSEGENIAMNLGQFAREIGQMFRDNPDREEYWIFMDACDSGLSVDAIEDLKVGLFDTIFEYGKDRTIYLVATANEYELASGEKCFDVIKGKYVEINSYEDYKKCIVNSRKEKDKRYS